VSIRRREEHKDPARHGRKLMETTRSLVMTGWLTSEPNRWRTHRHGLERRDAKRERYSAILMKTLERDLKNASLLFEPTCFLLERRDMRKTEYVVQLLHFQYLN
jgi:hypothetical protein